MKTLTVICPVYKEEEIIGSFYTQLRSVLNTLAEQYQSTILFVVDPSEDSTIEILKDIAADDKFTKVLHLSSRFGHQMALLAGMDCSDSDAVIMMDSDLQHPPSLIPSMLAEYEKGFEIVFTIRQDAPETGLLKRLTSKWFYGFLSRISEVPIPESAADFRLISRKVLIVFQKQIRERNQFLRGLFKWVGFRSTAIAFQASRRPAGTSKYSPSRMMRFGVHGVLSFSKKPLQASIFAGLVFALTALIHAVVAFIQYFYYAHLPSGWTTLVILISFFSGVQLIFLGIIAQYIGAIFDEVKNRPHYLIQEKINFPDE